MYCVTNVVVFSKLSDQIVSSLIRFLAIAMMTIRTAAKAVSWWMKSTLINSSIKRNNLVFGWIVSPVVP